MEQAEVAARPAEHPSAGLARHRVVAVHEGNRSLEPASGGRVDERGRAGLVERERLLADHVLARLERREREGHVEVVGSADVDDVHVRRLDESLGRLEGALRADPGGGLLRAAHRGCDHAGHPAAREQGGPSMHRADESGAYHPDSERGSSPHGRHITDLLPNVKQNSADIGRKPFKVCPSQHPSLIYSAV